MKRDIQGRFALKNDHYRSVRSLRLTDLAWQVLGEAAASLDITRSDLLEQIARGNSRSLPGITRLNSELLPSNTRKEVDSQPSNTWLKEEIERLNAEVQHLHQEKALLVERLALSFPQRANLEALRRQVLQELRLGKQAPGYKTALKALEHFIVELIKSDKNGVF